MMDKVLVEVDQLSIGFRSGKRVLPVVRDVSFRINDGETMALVGESGCGKSVTALALTRLLPSPPAVYSGGHVRIRERDIAELNAVELRAVRRTDISYIFQNPSSALNPVYTVGFQIREALASASSRTDAAVELLQQVGIPDPAGCLKAYPYMLSGGMQQRVAVAIALASQPRLIIADEPTTALDVTIQAQVLELLDRIRRERNSAMLLITHNLGLVGELADSICVMYAGQIVEQGAARAVLQSPRHPYTEGLIRAVPRLYGAVNTLAGIPGRVPEPGVMLQGCVFAERCPYVQALCRDESPALRSIGAESAGLVRCHFPRPHVHTNHNQETGSRNATGNAA